MGELRLPDHVSSLGIKGQGAAWRRKGLVHRCPGLGPGYTSEPGAVWLLTTPATRVPAVGSERGSWEVGAGTWGSRSCGWSPLPVTTRPCAPIYATLIGLSPQALPQCPPCSSTGGLLVPVLLPSQPPSGGGELGSPLAPQEGLGLILLRRFGGHLARQAPLTPPPQLPSCLVGWVGRGPGKLLMQAFIECLLCA